MSIQFCPKCDASMAAEARFCGHCGEETILRKREHRHESRAAWKQMRAASGAISLIFVGSLVGMVITSLVIEDMWMSYLAFCLVDVAICAYALRKLGAGSWRRSLGRGPDAVGVTLAILALGVTMPVLYYYAALFGQADTVDPFVENDKLTLIVFVAILPALVEEWMCRGVLFSALRPLTSRWVTILTTAALFAALHGLNGGWLLEMPHRFVSGIVYGWLRAKTGSLWPCVLAHFLHNGTAVVMFD